ncbi:MAG: hypothetical protein HQL23_02735 [Candidatus Omnitrophica bacterium]|nr:hypothetical protein [Candidatus Omnitrophota bacterium]
MTESDVARTQWEELKRKNNQVKFLLGGLAYNLHKIGAIRLVYSPDDAPQQQTVKKILSLLADVEARMLLAQQKIEGPRSPAPDAVPGGETDSQARGSQARETTIIGSAYQDG